ncbi:hypothetical protein QQF64_013883 [Cirrhinus molitorella]|uniref:Uncharacterized protein n=1 Tax=Cirrhinus molitorella TaxID=172907 RepID=A0ABR3LVZ9_9TELE
MHHPIGKVGAINLKACEMCWTASFLNLFVLAKSTWGMLFLRQPAAAAAAEAFITAVSEHNQHKIMDYIGFLYPQTAIQ